MALPRVALSAFLQLPTAARRVKNAVFTYLHLKRLSFSTLLDFQVSLSDVCRNHPRLLELTQTIDVRIIRHIEQLAHASVVCRCGRD